MNLTLKGLNLQTFTVDVDHESPAKELREKAADLFQAALHRIFLIFAGKMIEDEHLLGGDGCWLSGNSTVHVIVQPLPGTETLTRPRFGEMPERPSSIRTIFEFRTSQQHYQEFVKQHWSEPEQKEEEEKVEKVEQEKEKGEKEENKKKTKRKHLDPLLLSIVQGLMCLVRQKGSKLLEIFQEQRQQQQQQEQEESKERRRSRKEEERGKEKEEEEEEEEKAKTFFLSKNLRKTLLFHVKSLAKKVSAEEESDLKILQDVSLDTAIRIREKLFSVPLPLPPRPSPPSSPPQQEEKDEEKKNKKEEKNLTKSQRRAELVWDRSPEHYNDFWLSHFRLLSYIVSVKEKLIRPAQRMFVFLVIDEKKGAQAKEFQKLKTCLQEIWAIKRLSIAFI